MVLAVTVCRPPGRATDLQYTLHATPRGPGSPSRHRNLTPRGPIPPPADIAGRLANQVSKSSPAPNLGTLNGPWATRAFRGSNAARSLPPRRSHFSDVVPGNLWNLGRRRVPGCKIHRDALIHTLRSQRRGSESGRARAACQKAADLPAEGQVQVDRSSRGPVARPRPLARPTRRSVTEVGPDAPWKR